MNGYNGYVSLEMEDLTMSVEAGLQTVHRCLQGDHQSVIKCTGLGGKTIKDPYAKADPIKK